MSPIRAALIVLFILPLTGCLFRSHRVTPQLSGVQLQSASREELVERINSFARQVRTLNATVDIASSVGGEKTGKITEYQEIRGYILVRKPSNLRMIGLMPVIRNHAFDMVSNGSEFRLWIPPRNKFYIGQNNVVPPGSKGFTALRPQIIYDSLLLNEIDPQREIAVLESGEETVLDPKTRKNTRQPDYGLNVIEQGAKGYYLARKIHFSRTDLRPRSQTIYDLNGNISTQTCYDGWKQNGDIWFPSVIEITRPAEEYQITIGVVKLTVNEPLTDQQFSLPQPAGADVVRLNGALNGAQVSARQAQR